MYTPSTFATFFPAHVSVCPVYHVVCLLACLWAVWENWDTVYKDEAPQIEDLQILFMQIFCPLFACIRVCLLQYLCIYLSRDRQTDRQTDRQAGRQTDRQTDRQTGIEREQRREGKKAAERKKDKLHLKKSKLNLFKLFKPFPHLPSYSS